MQKKDLSNRVHLLDELRGLSILLMVFYHTLYDLVYLFDVSIPAFHSDIVEFLVYFFAGLFIFISGASSLYSRNNLKRGVVCFIFGLIFTGVTYLMNSECFDRFGILHMLGISMMIFPLISKPIKKINPFVGLAVSFAIFLITFNLPNGFIGFGELSVELPASLYQSNYLFWLGLPNISFISLDYFPLIPFLFLFISGSFLGVALQEKKMPSFFYKMHIKPLAFVGRHTIIIYLLHQPVVYTILFLIFSIL